MTHLSVLEEMVCLFVFILLLLFKYHFYFLLSFRERLQGRRVDMKGQGDD